MTSVHLVDLRPVCKLESVRCGPVEQAQICAEGCEEEYITHIFQI